MAEFNGASTLQELKIGHGDNASYGEDNSVSKAKKFQTINRILILRLNTLVQEGQSQFQHQVSNHLEELKTVSSWIDAKDVTTSGPSVTKANFENFRR